MARVARRSLGRQRRSPTRRARQGGKRRGSGLCASRRSGWLGDAVELRHSFVAGPVDREDAVEAGDFEDLRDVPVAADERELPVVRAQALDPSDEHAEGGRVDEGGRREIDDHLLAALADHLEQLLLELRGRVEVDFAGQGDHVGIVGELLGFDVEVHVSPVSELSGEPPAESNRTRWWRCCQSWATLR